MAFDKPESKTDDQRENQAARASEQLSCSVYDDLPEFRPPQCGAASKGNEDFGTGKVVDPSELPASVWDDLPNLRRTGRDLGTGKVVDPSQLPESVWDDLREYRPSRAISGDKKDVIQNQERKPQPHEIRYQDRSN